MYSRRQVEVAEEHGVVLKSIPVLDLTPFDKIFLDTQADEEQGLRVTKYYQPSSSFICNCHRHVPVYNHRKKLLGTLIDKNGNKYHDNSYDVYAGRIQHHHYCAQLDRYRYESDFNDTEQQLKYRPKKLHVQLTGQTADLHTVTYTHELDEEVLIIEDFGNTMAFPRTLSNAEEVIDMARYDEEIENVDRFLEYALGSWFTKCDMIHSHGRENEHNNLEETTKALVENLNIQCTQFVEILNNINRLSSENYKTTDSDEESRNIYRLRDTMRYILRTSHYDMNAELGSMWDFIRNDGGYDDFLKAVDEIESICDRLKGKENTLDIDEYYYILFGDKLKRKYEKVV